MQNINKSAGVGHARTVFLGILFLALPGIAWQAFEMYGLTIRGSQMLFFSVVHTMPVVALFVLAAFPLGLVVLLWAGLGLLLPTSGARLALNRGALFALAAYLMVHATLLAAYDAWSNTFIRVPVCILGMALFVGVTYVFGGAFLKHERPR